MFVGKREDKGYDLKRNEPRLWFFFSRAGDRPGFISGIERKGHTPVRNEMNKNETNTCICSKSSDRVTARLLSLLVFCLP